MNKLCPHCQNSIIVEEGDVGKLVTCPCCRNLFHFSGKVKETPFCPHCSHLLEENAKICIHCGYNMATKQCIESSIEREYDRFPIWRKALVKLYDIFPGLFKPFHIILFIATIFICLLLINLGLLVLGFGALLATIMLCSFGILVYAQGVAFLLLPRLDFLKQAMGEIEGVQWTIFLVMVFGPALGLFLLMIHMAPET